jgi:hypothetical protein
MFDSTKDRVLKPANLIKIRIMDIMNHDGWDRENWRGVGRIELKPIALPDGSIRIQQFSNGVLRGGWNVVEQTIPQLPIIRLRNGTIKRRSPAIVFYVIGSNGKKYRFLYFWALPNGTQHIVGTRNDIGAKYLSKCLSHKQWYGAEAVAARKKRVARRLRRVRRQVEKRFRAKYQIAG